MSESYGNKAWVLFFTVALFAAVFSAYWIMTDPTHVHWYAQHANILAGALAPPIGSALLAIQRIHRLDAIPGLTRRQIVDLRKKSRKTERKLWWWMAFYICAAVLPVSSSITFSHDSHDFSSAKTLATLAVIAQVVALASIAFSARASLGTGDLLQRITEKELSRTERNRLLEELDKDAEENPIGHD